VRAVARAGAASVPLSYGGRARTGRTDPPYRASVTATCLQRDVRVPPKIRLLRPA
jgi:hypothetical protein